MGLQLTAERVAGRPVLSLSGSGDPSLLADVGRTIAISIANDDFRVVNVDELLLTDTDAVRAFLAHLLDGEAPERVTLSCTRLSGRKLLRLWGGDDIAIFSHTEQAVAHAYAGAAPRPAKGRSFAAAEAGTAPFPGGARKDP